MVRARHRGLPGEDRAAGRACRRGHGADIGRAVDPISAPHRDGHRGTGRLPRSGPARLAGSLPGSAGAHRAGVHRAGVLTAAVSRTALLERLGRPRRRPGSGRGRGGRCSRDRRGSGGGPQSHRLGNPAIGRPGRGLPREPSNRDSALHPVPTTASTAQSRPSHRARSPAPADRVRNADVCSAPPSSPISATTAPAASDSCVRTAPSVSDGATCTAPAHRGAAPAPAPARTRDPGLADGDRPDARGNGLGQSSARTGGGLWERVSDQEGSGETSEPVIGRGVHRPPRCTGLTAPATPGAARTVATRGAASTVATPGSACATDPAADAAAATAPSTTAMATGAASATTASPASTRREADGPGFPGDTGAAPPASS